MSLGLCERAVQKALRAGAAQAEVYWSQGRQLDVEIEGGSVSCTSATRDQGGAVRIVRDDRLGFAYFTGEDGVAAAIEAALRDTVPAKGYTLPPGGTAPRLPGRHDRRVADAGPEDALEAAAQLIAGAAEGCPGSHVVGGGVSFGVTTEAIASSEGVAEEDASTDASVAVSLVLDGDAPVAHADQLERHTSDIDAHGFAAQTGRTLASLRDPAKADLRGRLDVVLWPEAVSSLAGDLASSAVDGDDAAKGKTVWSSRVGQDVAHAGLHLWDDPLVDGAVGVAPFDGEGLPATSLPLIVSGRLQRFVFSSWDAHTHHTHPTHSAVRDSFKARPETGIAHLVLRHDETRDMDGLVSDVDDGILVAEVLGAHTANATTGEFSVTATNVWRIRKGAIAGPVAGVALAGSLDRLLGGAEAAGPAKRLGGASIPPLLVRGLDVAS